MVDVTLGMGPELDVGDGAEAVEPSMKTSGEQHPTEATADADLQESSRVQDDVAAVSKSNAGHTVSPQPLAYAGEAAAVPLAATLEAANPATKVPEEAAMTAPSASAPGASESLAPAAALAAAAPADDFDDDDFGDFDAAPPVPAAPSTSSTGTAAVQATQQAAASSTLAAGAAAATSSATGAPAAPPPAAVAAATGWGDDDDDGDFGDFGDATTSFSGAPAAAAAAPAQPAVAAAAAAPQSAQPAATEGPDILQLSGDDFLAAVLNAWQVCCADTLNKLPALPPYKTASSNGLTSCEAADMIPEMRRRQATCGPSQDNCHASISLHSSTGRLRIVAVGFNRPAACFST